MCISCLLTVQRHSGNGGNEENVQIVVFKQWFRIESCKCFTKWAWLVSSKCSEDTDIRLTGDCRCESHSRWPFLYWWSTDDLFKVQPGLHLLEGPASPRLSVHDMLSKPSQWEQKQLDPSPICYNIKTHLENKVKQHPSFWAPVESRASSSSLNMRSSRTRSWGHICVLVPTVNPVVTVPLSVLSPCS